MSDYPFEKDSDGSLEEDSDGSLEEGEKRSRCTPHILRRTGYRIFLGKGVPLADIMKEARHTNRHTADVLIFVKLDLCRQL